MTSDEISMCKSTIKYGSIHRGLLGIGAAGFLGYNTAQHIMHSSFRVSFVKDIWSA
jgi:hypothetical protein